MPPRELAPLVDGQRVTIDGREAYVLGNYATDDWAPFTPDSPVSVKWAMPLLGIRYHSVYARDIQR